jgi:predicted ATPase
MLRSVRLLNWKAHRDTTVPLGKLTVLVGPNGTGKTTVLDAIHQLGLMARGDVVREVYKGNHDIRYIRRGGTADHAALSVEGVRNGCEFVASVGFRFQEGAAPEDDDTLRSVRWDPMLTWSVNGRTTEPALDACAFDELKAPEGVDAECWRNWLKGTACYRLDARVIAAPASSKHRMPRVQFDGRDTAAALKALKLGHDEVWTRILNTLREVVPSVTSLGVELTPAPGSPVPGPSAHLVEPSGEWYRIVFGFKGADRVPAFGASEGTLLTLAIITILHAPSRPNLILIDDVEQGLHPTAQMEMIRQLSTLIGRDEMRDVQIIATTHSPYVLDAVDFDHVCVFASRPDGSAAVKTLSQHPDAERLRGKLTAGELWTSDRESAWVVGD